MTETIENVPEHVGKAVAVLVDFLIEQGMQEIRGSIVREDMDGGTKAVFHLDVGVCHSCSAEANGSSASELIKEIIDDLERATGLAVSGEITATKH